MDDSNDCERDGEDERRNAPEQRLDIEHALEARGRLVPRGKGLTVRPAGTGVDGDDVLDKVIDGREDLNGRCLSVSLHGDMYMSKAKKITKPPRRNYVPARLSPSN